MPTPLFAHARAIAAAGGPEDELAAQEHWAEWLQQRQQVKEAKKQTGTREELRARDPGPPCPSAPPSKAPARSRGGAAQGEVEEVEEEAEHGRGASPRVCGSQVEPAAGRRSPLACVRGVGSS